MIRWLIISVLFSISLIFGFQKSTNSNEPGAVRKEIEKRLEEFKIEKDRECMLMAIKRAEAIVDSVIHRENSIPKIDTMGVPIRPIRPIKEKNIEIDTTEKVEPLFKN